MSQSFDDAFKKKYEDALDGLSDEQLLQVAKLNPAQRTEWVNSPATIRPYLLLQWFKQTDLSSPPQSANSKAKTKRIYLVILVAVLLLSAIIGIGYWNSKERPQARYYFELGVNCADKKNYDCAIENYTEAIKLNPDYSEAFDRRGTAYACKNQCDLAIADTIKASEIEKRYPQKYPNYSEENLQVRLKSIRLLCKYFKN